MIEELVTIGKLILAILSYGIIFVMIFLLFLKLHDFLKGKKK